MRAAAIAAAVVVADTVTKLELDVPAELLHDRPLGLAIAGALLILPVAYVGRRWPRRFATPAALIVAGAACNLAWVAFSAGGPDPIIVTRGGSFVAFNLADVAIAAGALLALARVAAGVLAELAGRPEPTR